MHRKRGVNALHATNRLEPSWSIQRFGWWDSTPTTFDRAAREGGQKYAEGTL